MKNLLIYEFLHNKKNKDLYGYYDISLNSSYDIWDIFIEKVLYSHKRKLYIFKKTFEKITANNKEDHKLFSLLSDDIYEYIEEFIKENMNLVVCNLINFLENKKYKKKHNINNSNKVGIIMKLFNYYSIKNLKKNPDYKKLQKIALESIEILKTEVNKKGWVDPKKRLKVLNIEEKIFRNKYDF